MSASNEAENFYEAADLHGGFDEEDPNLGTPPNLSRYTKHAHIVQQRFSIYDQIH